MTVTFQMAQRQKVPSNTVYKSEQLKLLVPVVCFAELVQTGFLSCLCIMHGTLDFCPDHLGSFEAKGQLISE